MTYRFRVTGHFVTRAPNDPNKDLEHRKVKDIPYTFTYYQQVPNFNPLRSTVTRLRVTGHFERIALMTPK